MRPAIVSWGLAIIMFIGALWWVLSYQEIKVVEILAPREPEIALPVYAQFVVTQNFYLDTSHDVTGLSLPLYVSNATTPLTVSLLRGEEIIGVWRYGLTNPAVVDVRLQLNPPRPLQGELTVRIDGSAISAADKDRAPRLMIEPADEAYPAGHYRIAGNDKRGDVGLAVWSRERQARLFLTRLREDPLVETAWVGKWLLLGFLVVILPRVGYSQNT